MRFVAEFHLLVHVTLPALLGKAGAESRVHKIWGRIQKSPVLMGFVAEFHIISSHPKNSNSGREEKP